MMMLFRRDADRKKIFVACRRRGWFFGHLRSRSPFSRRKIGVEIRKSCVAVAKPQAKVLVRQKAGDERNAAYEKDRSHH